MREDYSTAARFIAPAVYHIGDIGGGSREQKDIFLDLFLELQRRLGNTDQVIALAQRAVARQSLAFAVPRRTRLGLSTDRPDCLAPAGLSSAHEAC
jgi:hypothetical protein